MKRRLSALDRKQLDTKFASIRENLAVLQPPRGGWIRSLRTALGMRQQDLGERLAISSQAVADLERREAQDLVTLAKLRTAAHALGAELYYVVIPVRPINATLEERADRVARFLVGQVHHSMRMEDQATAEAEQKARLAEIKEHLLEVPSLLWTMPYDL
jgi:predicted DNA-binding mobile mystery protein A